MNTLGFRHLKMPEGHSRLSAFFVCKRSSLSIRNSELSLASVNATEPFATPFFLCASITYSLNLLNLEFHIEKGGGDPESMGEKAEVESSKGPQYINWALTSSCFPGTCTWTWFYLPIHLAITFLRESLSSLPGNPMHMIQERRVPPLDYEKSGKKWIHMKPRLVAWAINILGLPSTSSERTRFYWFVGHSIRFS